MNAVFSQVGIQNANKRGISESFGPLVMRGTMGGMTRPLFLAKVTQKLVDGRLKEVETPLLTQGVVQPFGLRELEIKPEGQRAWQWFKVHATPDLILKTEDTIIYRGERYKVMSVGAFDNYGYVRYDIVKAYASGA